MSHGTTLENGIQCLYSVGNISFHQVKLTRYEYSGSKWHACTGMKCKNHGDNFSQKKKKKKKKRRKRRTSKKQDEQIDVVAIFWHLVYQCVLATWRYRLVEI